VSAKTNIAWTDATWNPVTGCTKVSQGCKNCYAERLANRMWAKQYAPNTDGTPRRFIDIRLHADRLELPLRWSKPRMIFVNSVSDLFHESVPAEFILEVFDVMERAKQHTFQVLTKRAERMVDILGGTSGAGLNAPPLPNVWLGVSVEDQVNADKRIPLLLQTSAAVRFLSCEPLLSPVDLTNAFHTRPLLDWVIVGGESGPNCRRMSTAWAEDIVLRCQAAGVACFVKQMGGHHPGTALEDLPPALQVREYPQTVSA
jgi:protein gp37